MVGSELVQEATCSPMDYPIYPDNTKNSIATEKISTEMPENNYSYEKDESYYVDPLASAEGTTVEESEECPDNERFKRFHEWHESHESGEDKRFKRSHDWHKSHESGNYGL